MKTFVRLKLLICAGLAAGALSVGPAQAVPVTYEVSFEAHTFQKTNAGGPAAPVNPVTGSFTLAFDPTLGFFLNATSVGITLNSLSIPYDQPPSFRFTSGQGTSALEDGTLSIGTSFSFLPPGQNEFTLDIGKFISAPYFSSFQYGNNSSDNTVWYTLQGSVQVEAVTDVAQTPLPGALPLFATGIAGLAYVTHRRKRKERAVA
jgi:hypothetical protein